MVNRSVLLSSVVSVALIGPAFADDLTVSTKTTSPVSTSTASGGTAGNITIGSTGSVEIATSGAAVTIDSNNVVVNNGNITNTVTMQGSAVHILGNLSGAFTNSGNISLPGNSTTSTELFGVLLDGNGTFAGNIVNMSSGAVSVSGFNAGAFAIKTELNGNFTNSGSIQATGAGATGVTTSAVIDGAFVNTGSIVTISPTISSTSIDPNAGSGVSIGGSVLGGFLNGGPLNGAGNATRALITTYGSLPALVISPTAGGDQGAVTIGTLSDSDNPNNSFINRGNITSAGKDPAVSTTAVQIGNNATTANSYETIFLNGLYNSGFITATATSDNGNATLVASIPTSATGMTIGLNTTIPSVLNDSDGVISAATDGPAGGGAIAISILSSATLPSLNNAGTISASATTSNTGITALAAYGIVDHSGKLLNIVNSGTISATATTLDSGIQATVAVDLSASVAAATISNTGTVLGDIRFGSASGNSLTIEGAHALVNGRVSTVGLGRVNIAISAGGTGGSLITSGTIKTGTLTVGAGGLLDIGVGTGSTLITANNNVSFAATSQLAVRAVSLLPTDANITLIHSDTSLTFADFDATTAGIEVPFLFNSGLNHDSKNLTLNLQRKTATQLGLSGTAAVLYEPAMEAAATDAALGASYSALGSSAEIKTVLNQLSPIANGATRAMLDTVTDVSTNAVGTRQRALMFDTMGETRGGVWVQAVYNQVKDTSSVGYSGDGTGGTIGIEYADDKGHVGVGFTFFRGDASERSTRQADSKAQWFMLSPYAGIRSGNIFVDGQINVGAGRVRTERTVDTGSVTRVSSGKISETFVGGGVTSGYIFDLGGFQVAPEASLNGMYLGDSNYREKGGGTGVDLAIEARSMTALTAFLGVAGHGTYDTFGGQLTPHFLGGWSHDVVQSTPDINAYFVSVPSSDFTLTGPTLDRSRFVGAANVDFVWNKWQFGLGYNAAVRANAIAQTANFMAVRRF